MRQRYVITMDGSPSYKLILNTGDRFQLVAKDPKDDSFTLCIAGLVSDKQIVDLHGDFALEVLTDTARLNSPVNLKTNSNPVLEAKSAVINLTLVRNLSGNEIFDVSFCGSVSVRKVMNGGEATVSAGTEAAKISAEVFTVLSDWIDKPFSEIADLTLDKLIYKEV